MRARQRAGAIPDRPITLVFTADEEAGGLLGAHWLVEHRPDLLEGCTEAIGEVGGFSTEIGGQRLYLIESGEKGIAWMRLRARGTAGHGSMANHDNAITHLAHALITLGEHEWPERARSVDAAAARQGARAHRVRRHARRAAGALRTARCA